MLGLAPVAAACSDSDSPADDDSSVSAADAEASATSAAPSDATSPSQGAEVDAAPEPDDLPALEPADFAALGTCVLFPSSTAGPFPTVEQLVRRDISEGYDGHPLRLGLRVVDQACDPIPGAAVEVWHTDATGDYSSYEDGGDGKDEAEGTTFLRGAQVADADGIVEFDTIFPGWYPGRTVHIHLRVRREDELVLTGQLYFDDALAADVLSSGAYAEFGPPDTTNATDGIAGDPAREGSQLTAVAAQTRRGVGTLALANLGVSV